MKTSKYLSVAVLATLSFLLTAFTWAYWSNGVVGAESAHKNTIAIGQGNTASTVVNVANSQNVTGALVPVGRAKVSGKNAVEKIELVFDVKWISEISNTTTGTKGTLTVKNSSKKIGDLENNLVNVEIEIPNNGLIVTDGDAVQVKAIVTLTEPADKAAYDAIAGKNLVTGFEFSVVPNN